MMELPDFDALMRRRDAIGAAAIAVTEATHELSRTVHGTPSAAIPTDTAYGLLFHIKMLLHYTASLTEHLPAEGHSSLTEPGHNVHDMSSKAQRNLNAQIDSAATELQALTEALETAIAHTEATQGTVDYGDTEALR